MRLLIIAILCSGSIARGDSMSFEGFAAYSPIAAFDYIADGHGPSQKHATSLGAGAGIVKPLGRHFAGGASLRYEYAFGGDDSVHQVALSAVGALLFPLGSTTVRVQLALGPGFAAVPGYGDTGGVLATLGWDAELALGVVHRLGDVGIIVQLGIHAAVLNELNADDAYLDGGSLSFGNAFVRGGVAWR